MSALISVAVAVVIAGVGYAWLKLRIHSTREHVLWRDKFFATASELLDSPRLSNNVLDRLEVLSRWVRSRFFFYAAAHLLINTTRLRVAKVDPGAREQTRAMFGEMTDDERHKFYACFYYFLLALTYRAPIMGIAARAGLAEFLDPQEKQPPVRATAAIFERLNHHRAAHA
jgi:hypothetical protein